MHFTRQMLRMAQGEERAEKVLKHADVLNVFTGEWNRADVAICGEWIVGIGQYTGIQEIDCSGCSVVPGFIDAHMHIESTMLTPFGMAGEVVVSGTTALIADPHEIANVSGLTGLQYLLGQTESLPCNLYVMLPSCVPATKWDQGGAVLQAQDLQTLMEHPRVLGLGEMMDYPGVCRGDQAVLDKLALFRCKTIDGHAPMLSGGKLQAYRLAGVDTDHECSDEEEALEKLRAGFAVLVREGSAAHNLTAILSAVQKAGIGFDRLAFCTDDKHIEDIRQNGHIRQNIHMAIQMGIAPADAYAMASYHAARIYGLKQIGAVAAGYKADLVVVEDRQKVTVRDVYVGGMRWQERMDHIKKQITDCPPSLRQTVCIPRVTEEDLRIAVSEEESMPVIGLIPFQINTQYLRETVPQQNGYFIADSEYQKIAVIERHGKTGSIGLGIVKGFCLHGAVASTVAHDSHNLIVVGDNDADMLLAVQELERCGGGYTMVSDGTVLATLPLPIAGLMTEQDADHVQEKLHFMSIQSRRMGIPECYDPFLTLSFLSLPVIPELRITDRGIFDVQQEQYV